MVLMLEIETRRYCAASLVVSHFTASSEPGCICYSVFKDHFARKRHRNRMGGFISFHSTLSLSVPSVTEVEQRGCQSLSVRKYWICREWRHVHVTSRTRKFPKQDFDGDFRRCFRAPVFVSVSTKPPCVFSESSFLCSSISTELRAVFRFLASRANPISECLP